MLASRQCYDNPESDLSAEETIQGVNVHRCWTTRFGRGWLFGRLIDYLSYYFISYFRLLALTRKGDIVVAETDPPLISIVATIVCRLKGAHQINWLHDLFPEVAVELGVKGFRGPIGYVLRRLRNKSLKLADLNVVLGGRMAEYLIEQGIDQESLQIVHNWSDSRSVYPIEGNNPLRQEWGYENRFVVGYSGNMGRVHDFNAILDAATMLADEKDILFVFIGGGPQRQWVEDEVARRGLANVDFKPYQASSMLAQSLSLPDVHLISLRPEMEGFSVPSKFYGIAAAGRASIFIGSPDGEIARIVENEHCGAFVDQSDAQGLVDCIRRMHADPGLVKLMGTNARRALEDRFDSGVAIQAWFDSIARLWGDVICPAADVPSGIALSSLSESTTPFRKSGVCWIQDYVDQSPHKDQANAFYDAGKQADTLRTLFKKQV